MNDDETILFFTETIFAEMKKEFLMQRQDILTEAAAENAKLEHRLAAAEAKIANLERRLTAKGKQAGPGANSEDA